MKDCKLFNYFGQKEENEGIQKTVRKQKQSMVKHIIMML